MTNKKGLRKSKATVNNDEPLESHQKAAELNPLDSMDDQVSMEVKFPNVKSLNDELIKQISEKRQQEVENIESLVEIKAELIRSKAENSELRTELDKVNLKLMELKLMEVQIDELVKEKSGKESVFKRNMKELEKVMDTSTTMAEFEKVKTNCNELITDGATPDPTTVTEQRRSNRVRIPNRKYL